MWALVRRVRSRARCPRTRAAAGAGAPTRPAGSARSRARERDRAGSAGASRAIPVSPQHGRCAWRSSAGSRWSLFSVIFFRLWYLQILSGEQYVQQANANRVRDLPIPAPRGEILDREGQTIVASRIDQRRADRALGAAARRARRGWPCTRALGRLLGMSPGARAGARGPRAPRSCPYAPVTIKTDAGPGVLTVLGERASQFPGVVQQPVSIRDYPYGRHGRPGARLRRRGLRSRSSSCKAFRGVQPGTIVGQEGLEYYYDRYLRGTPGVERVEVNAEGLPGAQPARADPAAGRPRAAGDARPTASRRRAKRRCWRGSTRARAGGKPAVAGGVRGDGPAQRRDPLDRLLPLASTPTASPNRSPSPNTKQLEGSGSAAGPLTDRAVNGTYPTGSTFKPITAMAALEGGVISPDEGLGAGQCITVSTEQFCNAGHADYGAVGLVAGAEGLLRHVLLRSRRARQRLRRRDPEEGPPARDRAGHRHRPARASSKASSPTPPGASARTSARSPANTAATTAPARSSAK